ncbi:MAG: dTMP kinase [Candidatus Marinimicrobia bacterium]|jgi:dTMP kinase|nr:dTMP kinase [Candidatus Neomarinimicrobiota bacterium]MBT4453387.1 dTMP kinase [Candidatus Neomarinimicrobiota bacterium]MBT5385292.1 dTMP kinase [Candidatus Neomarinimicrobiota bacterium]MBT5995051.1 dTMP kinase [Candidatus Neomarinimicrobiota bacterium]MBT6941603.1 dTMP kinase [Candidatus Neomarinimicrobiota bacterium]|tara:strand:+ start:1076 stop:1705 length:630 start_codon:yes stop_codon:yes gene_type:complete
MSIFKGKFITFEGIDGCGKSTQVKLLIDSLNRSENKTILVREPGGTTISEEIRDILLHRHLEDICDRTEALLMTGSRAQLTYEIIQPNLSAGINVIADRYTDSTLAYQGGGRNIELEWLIQLNRFATYNLEPNVTFFVDILPEEASRRKSQEKDRIERAGIDLQAKVRNAYLELVDRFQDRFVLINGHDTIENIHGSILLEIQRRHLFE